MGQCATENKDFLKIFTSENPWNQEIVASQRVLGQNWECSVASIPLFLPTPPQELTEHHGDHVSLEWVDLRELSFL